MVDASSFWLANPGGGSFYNGVATQSLRFNDSDDANLKFDPSGTGNQKTWVCSAWVKKTANGNNTDGGNDRYVFNTFTAGNNANCAVMGFRNDKPFYSTFSVEVLVATQVCRDTSAWYHVVWALDTTQATATNRLQIYINGSKITSFSVDARANAYLDQDNDLAINNGNEVRIGDAGASGSRQNMAGYIAEMNFIDGQSFFSDTSGTANSSFNINSFGELKNGVWIPKDTSGLTFGTNGFRLDFADNAVDAPENEGTEDTDNIGSDSSGEHNNFTATNIVAADCAMPDSPENNFCTLNPLANLNHGSVHAAVHSEGSLKAVSSGSSASHLHGTFRINDFLTDGCYFEARVVSIDTSRFYFGVIDPHSFTGANVASYQNTQKALMNHLNAIYSDADVVGNNTFTPDTATEIGADDIIGVAVKGDDVWFHINGVYTRNSSDALGNPSTGANPAITAITDIAGTDYFPYFGYASSYIVNFGQDPSFAGVLTGSDVGDETPDEGAGVFKYAVPTGFKAICSANLPEPTIGPNSSSQATDYFKPVLYSGLNSTAQNVTVGFQPDWVWIKTRNAAISNMLYDSNRGETKFLQADAVGAEGTGADSLTDFTPSDGTIGFSLGADSSTTAVNNNGKTYVSWNWKANGGTATATISESGDNPAAVVQANPTAGFSLITYTGTGDSGTIAHGLSAVPTMMIIKNRDVADAWAVYHGANTAAPGTDYLVLNTNAATADAATYWADTAPTSSVFTVHDAHNVNADGEKYVAYVFADVEGYSKMGSYVGNGSANGQFVYTGFDVSFLMRKRTDSAGDWVITDSARDPDNVSDENMYANLNYVEYSGTETQFDFLSNGFKMRGTWASTNASGATYIYMAFAKNPFKYANAR